MRPGQSTMCASNGPALRSVMARPRAEMPDALKPDKLNYDQYRKIRFRTDRSFWLADNLPFRAEFFHPGYIYQEPVRKNEFHCHVVCVETNLILIETMILDRVGTPKVLGRTGMVIDLGIELDCGMNPPRNVRTRVKWQAQDQAYATLL